MKTLRSIIILGTVAQAALTVRAADIGDRCEPGDVPPRPGLVCQATDEWDYYPPSILNAKKGDIILSSSGGTVAALLQSLTPLQRYSHSGIVVQNVPMLIRDSTASDQWVGDDTLGHVGSDGFDPLTLKYAWPGTITETVEEAYHGHWLTSPEGKDFLIHTFHRGTNIVRLPPREGGGTVDVYPQVVKPRPTDEFYNTVARLVLEGVARAATTLNSHYRFYAFTKGDLVGHSEYWPPVGSWAHDANREGTVCSSFIWSATVLAGLTVEDPTVEIGDLPHPSDPELAGLYVYGVADRRAAGDALFASIFNTAYARVGGWLGLGEAFTDAADEAANQMCNTFAFDWSDREAKDSERWKNPGVGASVSPDNIMNWDAPPNGGYGFNEPLVYRPGHWARIYRWARSVGTGDAVVNVTEAGGPAPGVRVELRGFGTLYTGGCGPSFPGRACFVSVPAGHYEVEALKIDDHGVILSSASGTIDIPAGGAATLDLALTGSPPPPPPETRWHRKVTIRGTISGVEDDWPSDTFRSEPVSFSVVMDPISQRTAFHTWVFCVDNEVRLGVVLGLELLSPASPDVRVRIVSTLFEGASCDNDDADDIVRDDFVVREDSRFDGDREGTSYHLRRTLMNDEWSSDDTGLFDVYIENVRNP